MKQPKSTITGFEAGFKYGVEFCSSILHAELQI